jgi:hypothetical protein
MAEYQLAATELAMACNRNTLGRTTAQRSPGTATTR